MNVKINIKKSEYVYHYGYNTFKNFESRYFKIDSR